jgi:hypothetical protein
MVHLSGQRTHKVRKIYKVLKVYKVIKIIAKFEAKERALSLADFAVEK